MADFFGRRALYTNAKQAKHTFVSLGGDLEERQTRGGVKNMSLFFERLSAGGFLYRCGIRKGDRLISVNFLSVDGLPFEPLIDAIRSLTPLVLCVERTLEDGTFVPIVVVIEIGTDKSDEPYLKFHGFYFWKDTDSLDKDTIMKLIPIEVDTLISYHYDSSVPNTKFIGNEDNDSYWLTVDGSEIEFRRADSSKALFTMYKYNSNQVPQTGTPVILVPQDDTSQCLEATASNNLTLSNFDISVYTGSDPIPENGKFLFLVESDSPNVYKLESSMVTGQFIAKGTNDDAVMSGKGMPLTVQN